MMMMMMMMMIMTIIIIITIIITIYSIYHNQKSVGLSILPWYLRKDVRERTTSVV
jgi:uncharacterized integral membrane protein